MAMNLQRVTASVAVVGLLLASAGPAWGEAGRRADFSMRLTSPRPGTPTGIAFHVRFKAAHDPDAKPSPIKSVVIRGPDGLRYDNAAAPRCQATDAELQADGPSACPGGSQVGRGTYTAILGFGPRPTRSSAMTSSSTPPER